MNALPTPPTTKGSFGFLPELAESAMQRLNREEEARLISNPGETRVGEMEFDLIAHCGTELTGRFVSTLVLTDRLSGWTECAPVLVESPGQIAEALERLWWTMPFSLVGLDAESAGAFARRGLAEFCGRYGIRLSGALLHRPSEQAWVAPRNGAVIRRLVGSGRLERRAAVLALARLYARTRFFLNFVQPAFKSERSLRDSVSGKQPKITAETPASRLLVARETPVELKVRLKAVAASLEPLRLHEEIQVLQGELFALAKLGPKVRSVAAVAQRRRSSVVGHGVGKDGLASSFRCAPYQSLEAANR